MIAGGSDVSSRYIEYSDVPGGVFSCHGSSLVPVPVAIIASLVLSVWIQGQLIVPVMCSGPGPFDPAVLNCESSTSIVTEWLSADSTMSESLPCWAGPGRP